MTNSIRQILICMVGLSSIVSSNIVDAQTLFEIPDTTPNYSSYTYPEQCVAVMERLDSLAKNREKGWRDTIEFDQAFDLRIPSPGAVEAAQVCLRAAPVNVDTVPLPRALFWVENLLKANRDDDARHLANRLLDSANPEGARIAFLSVMMVYKHVRPLRYDALRAIYARAQTDFPRDSTIARFFIRGLMVEAAVHAADTAFAKTLMHESLADGDRLEWVGEDPQAELRAKSMMIQSLNWMYNQDYLDSLAVSTSAALSLSKTFRNRVYRDSSGGPDASVLHAPASKLKGEFWYRSLLTNSTSLPVSPTDRYTRSTAEQRPVPGRINLVVFLQGGCHSENQHAGHLKWGRRNAPGNCWRAVSALRRFKQMFPALEITLVVRTFGSIGGGYPLAPADEADTLAKLFLGFHRIPATLVVESTPFFKVAGLDQRRIDELTDNQLNYYETGNGQPLWSAGTVVGIDEHGRIFHYGRLKAAVSTDAYLGQDDEQDLKRKLLAVNRRIPMTSKSE